MKIVPLELRELNALIMAHHRHHKKVQGHRFSIGVEKNGELVAGCSVGRPVSREINQKEVLEVTRLVSNGEKNVCSMLYAAAARIGKEHLSKSFFTPKEAKEYTEKVVVRWITRAGLQPRPAAGTEKEGA